MSKSPKSSIAIEYKTPEARIYGASLLLGSQLTGLVWLIVSTGVLVANLTMRDLAVAILGVIAAIVGVVVVIFVFACLTSYYLRNCNITDVMLQTEVNRKSFRSTVLLLLNLLVAAICGYVGLYAFSNIS